LTADKAMLRTGSHIARGINAMSGAMAGSIPLNLVSWLSYDARPMPTRELFTWDGSETATSGARGHLWSWMLYHWLWNQRGKAFAEYQKRLAESGDPELPGEAPSLSSIPPVRRRWRSSTRSWTAIAPAADSPSTRSKRRQMRASARQRSPRANCTFTAASFRDPKKAAEMFTEDGAFEMPYLESFSASCPMGSPTTRFRQNRRHSGSGRHLPEGHLRGS